MTTVTTGVTYVTIGVPKRPVRQDRTETPRLPVVVRLVGARSSM